MPNSRRGIDHNGANGHAPIDATNARAAIRDLGIILIATALLLWFPG